MGATEADGGLWEQEGHAQELDVTGEMDSNFKDKCCQESKDQ